MNIKKSNSDGSGRFLTTYQQFNKKSVPPEVPSNENNNPNETFDVKNSDTFKVTSTENRRPITKQKNTNDKNSFIEEQGIMLKGKSLMRRAKEAIPPHDENRPRKKCNHDRDMIPLGMPTDMFMHGSPKRRNSLRTPEERRSRHESHLMFQNEQLQRMYKHLKDRTAKCAVMKRQTEHLLRRSMQLKRNSNNKTRNTERKIRSYDSDHSRPESAAIRAESPPLLKRSHSANINYPHDRHRQDKSISYRQDKVLSAIEFLENYIKDYEKEKGEINCPVFMTKNQQLIPKQSQTTQSFSVTTTATSSTDLAPKEPPVNKTEVFTQITKKTHNRYINTDPEIAKVKNHETIATQTIECSKAGGTLPNSERKHQCSLQQKVSQKLSEDTSLSSIQKTDSTYSCETVTTGNHPSSKEYPIWQQWSEALLPTLPHQSLDQMSYSTARSHNYDKQNETKQAGRNLQNKIEKHLKKQRSRSKSEEKVCQTDKKKEVDVVKIYEALEESNKLLSQMKDYLNNNKNQQNTSKTLSASKSMVQEEPDVYEMASSLLEELKMPPETYSSRERLELDLYQLEKELEISSGRNSPRHRKQRSVSPTKRSRLSFTSGHSPLAMISPPRSSTSPIRTDRRTLYRSSSPIKSSRSSSRRQLISDQADISAITWDQQLPFDLQLLNLSFDSDDEHRLNSRFVSHYKSRSRSSRSDSRESIDRDNQATGDSSLQKNQSPTRIQMLKKQNELENEVLRTMSRKSSARKPKSPHSLSPAQQQQLSRRSPRPQRLPTSPIRQPPPVPPPHNNITQYSTNNQHTLSPPSHIQTESKKLFDLSSSHSSEVYSPPFTTSRWKTIRHYYSHPKTDAKYFSDNKENSSKSSQEQPLSSRSLIGKSEHPTSSEGQPIHFIQGNTSCMKQTIQDRSFMKHSASDRSLIAQSEHQILDRSIKQPEHRSEVNLAIRPSTNRSSEADSDTSLINDLVSPRETLEKTSERNTRKRKTKESGFRSEGNFFSSPEQYGDTMDTERLLTFSPWKGINDFDFASI